MRAFAAGALLAMVADTLLTEAYEVEGLADRPAGRGGFATAIALSPSETRDANPSSSASRSNACPVS